MPPRRQVVNDSNVILIFEGIDSFIDLESGEETPVDFWLPKVFPPRIRVIITVGSNSRALAHLKKQDCQVLFVPSDNTVVRSMISTYLSRPSFIQEEIRLRVHELLMKKSDNLTNSLFVKTFIGLLMPYPTEGIITLGEIPPKDFERIFSSLDFEAIDKVNDSHALFLFVLEWLGDKIVPKDKFQCILSTLAITQKGLTIDELLQVAKLSTSEWKLFIAFFKQFTMAYKGLWKINNEPFKNALKEKFLHDVKFVRNLHFTIAQTLSNIFIANNGGKSLELAGTINSVRLLEEQTYHLYMARNYFALKEKVANIENFLLLFNPNTKYDLARYWQRLEQKGFDPVVEYNKALEGFEMHYHPSPQDMFQIFLQVSRFLKDFSDFETNSTPRFRHPPLV